MDKADDLGALLGPEPLELICVFSPPVVSGSYEKKGGS